MTVIDQHVLAAETAEEIVQQIDRKVRVYVRPTGDYARFLAVAYELNIAASGANPKDAFEQLRLSVESALEAAYEYGGFDAVREFMFRGPNAAAKADYAYFRVMRTIAHLLAPALPTLHHLATRLAERIEEKAKGEEYAVPASQLVHCCA